MKGLFNVVLLSFTLLLLTQCAPSDAKVQEELQKFTEAEKRRYPIKLDDVTMLDSCAAMPNKTLRYYYKVDIHDKALLDTNLIKNTYKQKLISIIKIDKGTSFLRNNNVTFEYEYRDFSDNYVCRITINPSDYSK